MILLLIPMMGIHLDMIQIKDILQTAPHLLQKIPVCSTDHLCIIRLLFRTIPVPAELTDKATIQNYYSRKARGQNIVQILFTPTVPQDHLKLLFAFG